MATEIVASDHTSATDEQIVNKEKSEAIANMIASLANEDEVKHDKTRDEDGSVTNPLSKTGDETNDEVVAVEIQKSDDSPEFVASAEDNLKRDEIEDAQTREDDTKAEPDASVEKTEGSVSLEAHIEDNLKEEKEVIPALHDNDDAGKSQPEEAQSEETPQQPEKEPIVTEEKQPKTVDILPDASSETIEKSTNTVEVSTQTEAELVKEAEIFETSDSKEEKPETEPEPVATEVEEKPQDPEKKLEAAVVKEAESLETSDQKEEKPEIEPVVLATEVEEKIQEPTKLEAEEVKEAETSETSDRKEEKPEHEVAALIPEVQEKPQEPEQGTTVVGTEPFPEVITIEEKTRDLSADILKETNESESVLTETAKAEPVVPEVEKNPKEPEKESLEEKEEKQPNTIAIAEVSSETIQEKTSEPEVLNETNNYETEPTKVERAVLGVTKVDENSSEPEKISIKQEEEELPNTNTVTPETATAGDIVNAEPRKESDTEVVKEIANSETELIPGEEEKPDDEVVVNQPIESDIEVVKETSIITENTALVSLNEEAQAALQNLVETAPEVAEKVVEQASIDQKGKTDIEEREYSIPTIVEETFAFAVANDKKESEAPGSIQVSAREASVEINKDEKQIEAKTATTEDDEPAVKNEKEGHVEVDEIVSAVTEPDTETLASKFEEKETTKTEVDNSEKEQSEVQVPEEPTKENDATKASSKDLPKETPAKTAQKQSNSIISKVKHSLAKAKKAIIGKSPSSKNHSTEAKDDIQVK